MCRIVGGWEFSGGGGNLFKNIEKMRDTMRNGGPDSCGVYYSRSASVALAHRRLSIIDLTSFSHQPYCSADGRYILTYNGEIYNYKEVAKELEEQGVKVVGRSDTEILLLSFIHWGIECVQHFDGMFAFGIFDELEQKLYICRDRVGVKPLYYYFDEKCFLFSSELKGLFAYPPLDKTISKEALGEFLSYGYIRSPLSILEKCFKLEGGHYLIVSKNRSMVKKSYYAAKDYFKQPIEYDKDSFKQVLERSISLRMVSDVPVGVLLSGGVDSSLVCVVLKSLGYDFETFTMGFREDGYGEGAYAKQVASYLGIKNTEFICGVNEAKELIPTLPYIYDEPFGDSSSIPTLLLSQKIRHCVKVALSADGGDELGLGYDRYFWSVRRWREHKKGRLLSLNGLLLGILSPEAIVELAQKFGMSWGIDKVLRIKNQLRARNFMEHYRVEITHFRREDLIKNHLKPLCKTMDNYILSNPYLSMSYFDFCNYLPEDILTKTDRASMSVGLEIREPLLGVDLVAYMLSLALKYKIDADRDGKIVFKKYLENFLPKELIYRPKMGFGVPLQMWMQTDLFYLLEDVSKACEGYLDKEYIASLIVAFRDKKRVDFAKIWYLYVLATWLREWNIR